MQEYHVTWSIEVDADTPEEAAAKALAIQRDVEYTANHFVVTDENENTTEFDFDPEFARSLVSI